jgi:thiol:disulfide interchange protein DsbA
MLSLAAVLLPWAFGDAASAEDLKGNYTALKAVPTPHSLDTVVVEEFLNFSCPHCNKFREVAKPVFEKYGKRVKLIRIPILFRGQDDAPLRLFYVGQAKGLEDRLDEALFSASFKSNVNVFDPRVVSYLARSEGIKPAYDQDASSEWVTARIADGQARADAYGVEATPTLVLQGALRMVPETTMEEFVGNFDRMLAQLLKRPRAEQQEAAAESSPAGK